MRTYLTIKNYRCFVRPITVEISKGFTAFVGVNNAGKSAIMRFLLEFRPFFSLLSNQPNIGGFLQSRISFNPLHVLDPVEIFSNTNNGPIEFSLRFVYGDRAPAKVNVRGLPVSQGAIEEYKFLMMRDLAVSGALYIDDKHLTLSNQNVSVGLTGIAVEGNYVIVFESLIGMAMSLANSLYVGPFRNTLNVGTKTDYLDIQIGQSFIGQFRELKTGSSKKSNTDISRLTDDIRKVFEFESLDISPTADNSSLHLTVNGKPYKQHEVGSGLTHFVIVLANAAIKNPKWILIDEPELNLHPALQLDFLTTLAKYAEEGVWFSTHSIGLARSAATKVYSVLRIRDGDSDVRPLSSTLRLAEFLGEMSFSSHKELGFEKVLLVEGPTEVPTIQQFLRMIKKDHKILLLPLHGHMPKADELEEILRITPDVAALIDSEKVSAAASLDKGRQEFLALCASNGLKSHALNKRATENYFPDAVVKRVFGVQFRALGPYEKLSDASPNWSKSQNWKMAADMSFDDIRNTDLGKFLEEL
jgi:ABC-type cobalamin/Fe3+-siderophores transport system ATPase subunit